MYNKYHVTILRKLFQYGYIGASHTAKESALKGFPKSERGSADKALKDLVHWNFIIQKKASYGEQIRLNHDLLNDIRIIINPNVSEQIKDRRPIEDQIDPSYELVPFHTTHSDKIIGGRRGKYSYHRDRSNAEKIKVYIYSDQGRIYSFNLGSFNDGDSLLSRTVKEIDKIFEDQTFERSATYNLGKEIVGNKQSLKAAIDMLLYFKYLIEIQPKYYKRTTKQLPKATLD